MAMNTAEDLGQSFLSLIHQSEESAQVIKLLTKKVDELSGEVKELKESNGDQGWMKAELAAKRVGMKGPALRQRIRNKKYIEGTVWRHSTTGEGRTRQIIVNLAELRKVI